jgi:16S rRNA (guanine966-N2)-methyltransferase
MRIIGGTHRGYVIKAPKDLPVRPTTDFAKEGLFNILSNRFELEDYKVLDLFSGTGHISLEFASRGAKPIIAIDQHFKCIGFLKAMAQELKFDITPVKSDVFEYLKKTNLKFDLIFADPPYDLKNIPEINTLVFERNLLNDNGILIIEHGSRTDLSTLSGFTRLRNYGNVNFSFFEPQLDSRS